MIYTQLDYFYISQIIYKTGWIFQFEALEIMSVSFSPSRNVLKLILATRYVWNLILLETLALTQFPWVIFMTH